MYECLLNADVKLGDKHSIMVVLGWYPFGEFNRRVSKDKYGVVGSLFNANYGGNILITNLLYNPQITTIVLCSITLADEWIKRPCVQLKDRLMKSDDPDVVELLKHITIYDVATVPELILVLNSLTEANQSDRKRVIKQAPTTMKRVKKPCQLNGQSLIHSDIKQARYEVCKRILSGGVAVNEKKQIIELLNVSITLTGLPDDMLDLIDQSTVEQKPYIQQMVTGTRDPHNYGYGDRLLRHFTAFDLNIDQIATIKYKLKKNPDTLTALMCVWDVATDLKEGVKSPCLTQVWLRRIDNVVHMSATFRSNDMFKAWESNALGLRGLQIKIADHLECRAGDLTTLSMSAHIYEQDADAITNFIDTHPEPKPSKHYHSCVGNFTIKVIHGSVQIGNFEIKQIPGNIEVVATDNTGKYIETFTANTAYNILEKILTENPTIERDHLLYLTDELYRAERCFLTQQNYKQK